MNRILPPETIAQSEVVVVWGKNITVTASHLMPYLEGKKIIVIDPIATPIAKQADLFVQISPQPISLLPLCWHGLPLWGIMKIWIFSKHLPVMRRSL